MYLKQLENYILHWLETKQNFPMCWCWPLNWKTSKSVQSRVVDITYPLAVHGLEAGQCVKLLTLLKMYVEKKSSGETASFESIALTLDFIYYRKKKKGAQALKSDK